MSEPAPLVLASVGPFSVSAFPNVPGLKVRPIDGEARFALRLRPENRAAAERTLGAAIPETVGATDRAGGCAVLCLGPDEWRIVVDPAEAPAIVAAFAAWSVPHALVDVSDREAVLELDGPLVEAVLAAGCPLDLSLDAFPVGRATRTLWGKAGVFVWRRGVEVIRLECGRSFALYLIGRLAVTVGEVDALARRAAASRG